MKILALSDYGHTGINESISHPLMHWHNQGHEIWQMCLGFNGWTAFANRDEYPWADRLLRVIGEDQGLRFGEACLYKAINLINPDVVLTSFDVWMVRYLCEPHAVDVIRGNQEAFDVLDLDKRKFKHIAYFPIDGLVDNQYLPRQFDEMIAGMDVPITYSRFAKEAVLRDTGLDIPFIPIAHDPTIFHPGSKKAARERLSLPEDAFIVAMVGTNQYRKLWGEFIDAAGRLARKRSDVVVIPWTTWDMQIAGGFDVTDLVYRAGISRQTINPGNAVGQATHQQMADFYRAADVLVLTTVGEGAGLPPLRARACGTPALVSANTANIEFTADPFELIPCKAERYDNGNNLTRFLTDTDVLYERLLELYSNRNLLHDIGEKAAHAMMQYSTPVVMPQWDAVLEGL